MYFTLCLVGKLKSCRTLTGLVATPAHATAMAMHFPANAGHIFLTDKLTRDRYLVDTGVTLSTVPCTFKINPSGPCSKGQLGNLSPCGDLLKKTVQFQGKLFTSNFLQAAVAGPILGIDFLRKSMSLLPQRPAKYFLLALQRLRPPLNQFTQL